MGVIVNQHKKSALELAEEIKKGNWPAHSEREDVVTLPRKLVVDLANVAVNYKNFMIDNTFYFLIFEYQTCFDDGSWEHECWWKKSEVELKNVRTDRGAERKAKIFINEHNGKHPCNGGNCTNRGLYRRVKIDKRTTFAQLLKVAGRQW